MIHSRSRRGIIGNSAEIQLLCVDTTCSRQCTEACYRLLSSDERLRADAFHSERARSVFTVSRGILRALLAYNGRTSPEDVRFVYGDHGKPALTGHCGLQFNVSHSGKVTIIALGFDCQIGVDIEEIREVHGQEHIVRNLFSKQEYQEWLALHPSRRATGFWDGWTRKEAYVKALGEGLSVPLNSFSVTLRPNEPARIVEVGGDRRRASRWSLYRLSPRFGYVGALAVSEPRRAIRLTPSMTVEEILGAVSGRG